MKPRRAISHFGGFAFTELLVVIAVVLLAAVFGYAYFSRAKIKNQSVCCNCNLKQVGLAFRLWGDDNGAYPMRFRTNNFDGPSFAIQGKMYVYFQVMSNELNTPTILMCPSDNRTPAPNFIDFGNDNVSYFVGLDADEIVPQMFLAGDRNLMVNGVPASPGLMVIKAPDSIGWTPQWHQGRGNVVLADGSVQGYALSGLQQALRHTGTNVNRLAIP
jgi:prepilin-type processing-associated H-X9-DG protein